MTISTPTLDNPLESAITNLRAICSNPELLKSSIDAGSARRILVHITNINSSVLASTQDHVNARKRLNDFAVTLSRMAKNSESSNEVLTTQMTAVTTTLRAASEGLARSDGIPKWRAPASVQ